LGLTIFRLAIYLIRGKDTLCFGREALNFDTGICYFYRMKKVFCIAIAFFFLQDLLPAQNAALDSLKEVVKANLEDTNQVNALNAISQAMLISDEFPSSLQYAKEARSLAQKLGFKKGMALAYKTIGTVNYRQGHYPEALGNYFSSLKLMEELGDKKGMANCYNNIGSVYDFQGNNAATNKYYLAALEIRKELGDKPGLAMSYNNIGIAYINQGDPEMALANLNQALKLLLELNDKRGIASCYANISSIYYDRGDYGEALKNDLAAMRIREAVGEKEDIAMSCLNIAGTYEKMKKYKDAESYCLKGLTLSKEIGYLELIKLANQTLSDIYFNSGRYPEALQYYKASIIARDSLFNEENTKRTVRLEMNYEFEKKEARAKLELEKKEAVAAAERHKQRIILWSVSGVGLLVFCFALFAYRSYLHKQKANEAISRQKALIEEKQTEILDSLYYARRIQRSLLTQESYIEKCIKRLKAR